MFVYRSPGNNPNLWSSGDCTSSTPSVHSEHNSVSYGSLERTDHLWDPDQHDLGSSFLPDASVVFADSRYAPRDQPRALQSNRERLHYTKSLQQQQQQLPLFAASQLSGHLSDRPVTSSQIQHAVDVDQRNGRVISSDKWRATAPEHAKPQADVFRGNERFDTSSQNGHGALPHDMNGRDVLYAHPATNGTNLASSEVFDKELLVKKLLAQQHAQQLPPGGVTGGYGGGDSVHEKGFDRGGRLYMDVRPCDSHALQFRSQPPGNVMQPISVMTSQSPGSYLNGGYSNPCTPDSLTDAGQMPFEVQQQQQQQAIAVTNARYNRMLMQQQQQQQQQKVASYQKFIHHAVPRQSTIAPVYDRRPTAVTAQPGPPTLAPYRGAHSFPFYTHRQRHVSDTGYDVCYTGTEACLPHGSLSLPDHFSTEQRVPFSKEFAFPCHCTPIIDDVIMSEFTPGFPPATTAFPAKFHPGYPPPHLHGQFGVEATFDPYCQQFDPFFRGRVVPPIFGSGHDVYFDMFSHHFVNGIPPFFHGFKPPR